MRLSGALAPALVSGLALALLPSLALAQGKDAPPDAAGEEATPEDEPIPSYDDNGEPAGATENPDAPKTDWDKPPVVEAKVAAPVRTGYPIERIYRPLVLPRRMIEAGLEVPLTVNPGSAGAVLRGAFGVTHELQLGLRYNTFTATEDDTFGGKAFAIDADYLIFPWLAAQVSLPVNVDPYSQGLVLGAPMKFTFVDKFSIEVLRDFIGFKLYRFLPSAISAAENEALAIADEQNAIVPDGELNVGARFTYQFAPNLAGDARYNIRMVDFKEDGAPHELTVGAWYSTSAKLDLAARLGFLDMANASDSFAAQLLVAFRM